MAMPRFVSDSRNGQDATGTRRRIELAAQQFPFAIILGCSDLQGSRRNSL